MGQAREVVNKFYDLYLNRHTVEGLENLLAEDMRFVGPLAESSSAAEHLQVLTQVLPTVAGWKKIKQFENGDDVITIYELHVNAPNGQRLTVPMSEWTRISGGRMVEQTLYYDPREFAQAFGM
jgi:hypothetical protein